MNIAVSVERELCIGSGNCVHITNDAMQLDDEGVATLVDVDGASAEQFRRAARSCPTDAIFVQAD